MTTSNQIGSDETLMDTGISSQMRKIKKERPKAALGNMRTHLYLENENSVWVSVGRGDLEKVLAYVETLENRQAILLKRSSDQAS